MKTPKVKKREVSIHSRAARRGTSPSSKDLTTNKAAAQETEYKPWVHSAQNADVSKKKTKVKPLSRQQKLRQQRGLQNAERNSEKLEKKVKDSKIRGRRVQARRVEWEMLNEKLMGKENQEEVKGENVEGRYGAGGERKMEGVEGPLAIRVAEDAVKEPTEGDGIVAPG